MWCFGNTCVVRHGEKVIAGGMELIPGARPLNNARWTLYERSPQKWILRQKDKVGRTREPSPIGIFDDGRLFMSVNPALRPQSEAGPAKPEILEFSLESPESPPEVLRPDWGQPNPDFTEHSYRSFALDGRRHEMILFQNVGYSHARWAFMDFDGVWSAQGRLDFPWGEEYDQPQPIRVCYPTVSLSGRSVYFCGVSDIKEPRREWAEHKFKLTGRNWDYDFRRLFYTWCPDIGRRRFEEWVEVSSREDTAGWITPCDLHVGQDGLVHLLWLERALDDRLKCEFFPQAKQSIALNYGVVRDGRVRFIHRIAEGGADPCDPVPGAGRFQMDREGRLLVLFHIRGGTGPGQDVETGNYLTEAMNLIVSQSEDPAPRAVRIPLRTTLPSFFTATPRAGCEPSNTIDMLGQVGSQIRYASIVVE